MPDQLERDLVRALSEAARVPTPDDLPARVERRARVRRRRRIAVGAGVLALAAPVLLLPSMGTPTQVHTSPPPSPVASASPTAAPTRSPVPVPSGPLKFPSSTSDQKPAAEVWPKAIVRFTDLPGYAPVGLLDRDHALLTWDDRADHVAALYTYDLRDRSKVKLADLADPPGAPDYSTLEVTVTPTEILWWGRSANATYVWALPRSGGSPHLVAKVAGARNLEDMRADADGVYWSGTNTGGVYRLDRRTGELALMPGLEQFRLTGFPWASSLDRAPVLHNVVTNEEIVVRSPADTNSLWCVPAICIGEGGPAFSHFAMRPDGSHRVDLLDADLRSSLIGGRYVLALNRSGRNVLIDVQTGKAGWLYDDAVVRHDAVYWPESGTTVAFYPTRA